VSSARNSGWTTVATFGSTDNAASWSQKFVPIPSQFIGQSNVYIRFMLSQPNGSTYPTWKVDDVALGTFTDPMESTRTNQRWTRVSNDHHGGSYSYEDNLNNSNRTGYLPSGPITIPVYQTGYLTSPSINLSSYSSANLTFKYQLPQTNTAQDTFKVQMCQGNATACPNNADWDSSYDVWTLPVGSPVVTSWAADPISIAIPPAYLSQNNVYVRFYLGTTSTTAFPQWYVDDVKITAPSFTPWSTLLVRLEEKLLTAADIAANGSSQFSAGNRINKIMIYYSTPSRNPSNNVSSNHPNGATDDYRTGSNPSGTMDRWPEANGAIDPNFTLVQWDWVRDEGSSTSTYKTAPFPHSTATNCTSGSGCTAKEVWTNYYLSNSYTMGGELGLSVFGLNAAVVNRVFFDDLAVKIGSGSGSSGSGAVIQY
jgi:hypothetical protein